MTNHPRIFVALDYADVHQAYAFVERISPDQCGLKVGKELFIRAGAEFIKHLVMANFRVFLDLKFHDIPNQVAGAVKAAADLGVKLLTVHASGGSKMLTAALNAVASYPCPPQIIAVTVLTSLAEADFQELGMGLSLAQFTQRLTTLAYQVGIRGFVSSAHEVATLKQLAPEGVFITPGIRLDNHNTGDQSRVMTPRAALAAGADYLVIGRPITLATDPVATLHELNTLINKGEL